MSADDIFNKYNCELGCCPLFQGECIDSQRCMAQELGLKGTGWDQAKSLNNPITADNSTQDNSTQKRVYISTYDVSNPEKGWVVRSLSLSRSPSLSLGPRPEPRAESPAPQPQGQKPTPDHSGLSPRPKAKVTSVLLVLLLGLGALMLCYLLKPWPEALAVVLFLVIPAATVGYFSWVARARRRATTGNPNVTPE